ncbi:MAG: D-glycerate dehydrogenase [Minisyncoccia bacterium]
MSKNIYVTRRIPEIGLKMLRDKGYNVDVRDSDMPPTCEELNTQLKGKSYDVVVTLLTDKIDSEVYEANPGVKLYANYAIGFDNIDIVEAKKRGIYITNTPGAYANCVAEHAIALMLALTTRLVEGNEYVRAGKYKCWSPDIFIGTDLSGKTLGLIGAGRIGEKVAWRLMHGFDMKIIYHDIKRNETLDREDRAVFKPTIEEVLREADIVTLHTPLLPDTKHLINEDRLRMMKPTAFLINTSRGPVVDEKALLKALKEGWIKGAGLDVMEFEPNPVPGLTDLDNVIITPHIASARQVARDEMATVLADNIIDFFEGKEPRNNVAK